MSDSVEIAGLDEALALLDEAPRRLASKGFPKALIAASGTLGSALLANTPRAEAHAGEVPLADSLVIDISVDNEAGEGHAEIGFGGEGYRALLVEYGHNQVTHDGRTVGFTPAHPFMRPTADTAAESVIDAFADAIGATCRQEYE